MHCIGAMTEWIRSLGYVLGVIHDLVEMQTNLLLGSPLIELALEAPLGRVPTLKNLPSPWIPCLQLCSVCLGGILW